MKKQLAKLIDVKSIVTLMLALVFAVLALKGQLSPEQFLTVFTVVISFYFGTQYQKKTDKKSIISTELDNDKGGVV